MLAKRAAATARALFAQRASVRTAAAFSTHSTFNSNDEHARAALRTAGITSLLVANRGEIACRVMATAKRLGLKTFAIYSEADRGAKHVQSADEAYFVGGAAASDSYLKGSSILELALRVGAQAIHPGYGFLSENADFAESCKKAGVVFVGPPATAIRDMGDKAVAKARVALGGVPCVPGYHGSDQSDERLLAEAEGVGFPLLVKAVCGGGGKGMKLAATAKDLPEAITSARQEAMASFGSDSLLLERYVSKPRHVEVQVVADAHGHAVSYFDRDCSVQRRHQKILEEAPAPGLTLEHHARLGDAAVRAALAAGYTNAGTVEFILDMGVPRGQQQEPPFYFMEMNTRLQVEHPITEAVTGVDLVALQLLVAAGGQLPVPSQQGALGHAFEARLYAENPANSFFPGAGTVRRWRSPAGSSEFCAHPVRVDSGIAAGDEVGTFYDGMIAKIIAHGCNRDEALATLQTALSHTQVAGLPTNLHFLQRLAAHPAFSAADIDTGFIAHYLPDLLSPEPLPFEVAALAGVVRHMIQRAFALRSNTHQGLGPWSTPDSKRLWHNATKHYSDICLPTPTILGSSTAAATGSCAGTDAGDFDLSSSSGTKTRVNVLDLSLEVTGEDSFHVSVAGAWHEPGTEAADGSKTQHSSSSSSSGCGVSITGARLQRESDQESAHASMPPAGAAEAGTSWKLEAEVDGRRMRADVLQYTQGGTQEILCLWVEGHQLSYEFRWPITVWSRFIDAAAQAAASPGAQGGRVTTPMPGRVTRVLVSEGCEVVPGQVLLAIEAMKMEHSVLAPRGGILRGLAAVQGQQVADAQVIAWIDAEGEAESRAGGLAQENFTTNF